MDRRRLQPADYCLERREVLHRPTALGDVNPVTDDAATPLCSHAPKDGRYDYQRDSVEMLNAGANGRSIVDVFWPMNILQALVIDNSEKKIL